MNQSPHSHGCASDYHEYPAHAPLRGRLLCFWTQAITGSSGEYAHRVLPDACIDVVIVNDQPPILVGPWTESFIASFPPGSQIVGARFHPGRAPGLLGLPASELLNLSVPVCEALRRTTGIPAFARVTDQASISARKSALEATMHAWLAHASSEDLPIRAAIRWLAFHPQGRVEALSQFLSMSPRQVHRRFTAAVGYGPKLFQSVIRFQRLINLASSHRGSRNLAGLAADAGYADQAHMTREVRRFSGKTPLGLFPSAACALRLSELFAPPLAPPEFAA
jgi:AraC-like DNA-binding protein